MTDTADRLRRAASTWHLTVGEPLAGGTSSAVFAATDEAGRDLVVKLPAARAATGNPTGDEAAALSLWASTGAVVRLVDASADALLLIRARPGLVHPWSGAAGVDDAVAVAAELLPRLWTTSPGRYPFPSSTEVYPEDERVAREDAASEQRDRGEPDRGAPALRRLPAAAAAVENLLTSCDQRRLLHGDFITKNLVSDASSPSGWVALDPLPMTGDPAAEVAAFAAYHPAEQILPIAEKLARAVRLDVRRTLRWAAVWTVHQAAQAWRDDQGMLEELVVSPSLDDLLTR
ncbi:MAG TPA: aminoglycoside phosphotransferase family protein [Microlunatus sp.]|nr:aminoglycoside phosphotransferase family protein [Microlunatus sp.]